VHVRCGLVCSLRPQGGDERMDDIDTVEVGQNAKQKTTKPIRLRRKGRGKGG